MKKVFYSFLALVAVFTLGMTNANALEANYAYNAGSTGFTDDTTAITDGALSTQIGTKYNIQAYTITTYDVTVTWEDLEWTYVYLNDASNPTKNGSWIRTSVFNGISAQNDAARAELVEANPATYLTNENINATVTVRNNATTGAPLSINITGGTSTEGMSVELKYATSMSGSYGTSSTFNVAANSSQNVYLKPTKTTNYGESNTVTGTVRVTITGTL